MASQELSLKLHQKLRLEQEAEVIGIPQQNGLYAVPAPAWPLGAELKEQLNRRQGMHKGTARLPPIKVFKLYTEFPEFSHRQIKDMESLFRRYDSGKDGYIDLMQLKLMMEKLGAPQTHLGLKEMIRKVDEDLDSKLSFREFLLIFSKAASGGLGSEITLMSLAKLSEINVAIEGVKGAKNFFEAKDYALSMTSRFEAEIKAEQNARKQEAEDRKQRRALFRERRAAFSQ
ncbi:EF-hand domain-containing protein D1-like isoform X2 [Monodelphis domestica]|uniref:EF-hand domain-containing protein D1-like isoform X2 n=1 Tax=Monodelphis domestica TaxID=13616 RepID=UPI0024E24622|nr:EF-hand domain-containing protein D1-like isoform X2 [Monodelphis domestica]